MAKVPIYASRMRLTILKEEGDNEQQLCAFEILLDEDKLGDLVYRANLNKSHMVNLAHGTFIIKTYPATT